MGLDSRIISIGIIVMFLAAMMPYSALIILSLIGTEVMILGIREIFFYLGWFINPVLMIVTGIIVMRVSRSSEYSRGMLAGIILALTYTAVVLLIQLTFTPEGPMVLPFSGINMPEGYMNSFYELIIKAYVFCIAGGLTGAYSASRIGKKGTSGESFLGEMR